MNRHQNALTLASIAIDFPLTAHERAALDDHLAACDSCTRTARALRSDAAAIACLPVPRLDRRRAEVILARVVDAPAPGRPVLRLLVVMAILTLLALGSLAVGAEMLRRADQEDLSVVPPVPSPSMVADASPVADQGIGLSWAPVTMPGWTVPDPGGATMNGVIAGGPGAIAWGWAYGVPAQVWTTSNGIDWQPEAIEFPGDADPEYKEPGEVTSITAWGTGYVAAGYYHRLETGRRSVIWTSTDGRAWTLLPHDPIFENGVVSYLVPWRGELLAFGYVSAGAGGGGADAKMWSSLDGVTWQAEPLQLPAGLTMQFAVATSDGLWAYGGTAGLDTAPDGCRASCRESSHRPMAAPGPRHRCRGPMASWRHRPASCWGSSDLGSTARTAPASTGQPTSRRGSCCPGMRPRSGMTSSTSAACSSWWATIPRRGTAVPDVMRRAGGPPMGAGPGGPCPPTARLGRCSRLQPCRMGPWSPSVVASWTGTSRARRPGCPRRSPIRP